MAISRGFGLQEGSVNGRSVDELLKAIREDGFEVKSLVLSEDGQNYVAYVRSTEGV